MIGDVVSEWVLAWVRCNEESKIAFSVVLRAIVGLRFFFKFEQVSFIVKYFLF